MTDNGDIPRAAGPGGTPPTTDRGTDRPADRPADGATDARPADGATDSATDDQAVDIMGRLLYLTILLRVADGRLRRGSGRGRRSGVLEGQGRVLRLLDLHSPIAQKELAYLLGIRSQSLGELLAKLEQAGCITRSPSPDDRRTAIVEITDLGRSAAGRHTGLLDEDTTFGLDPDELRQFSGLLDTVIDHIEGSVPGGIDRRLQRMRAMWSEGGFEGDPRAAFGWPGGPAGGFDRDRFPRGGRGGGRAHRGGDDWQGWL